MEKLIIVGCINARAAGGLGSRRYVHKSLNHAADVFLSVRRDGHQSEVVRELYKALDNSRPQDVVILLEIIPHSNRAVQIHNEYRISPSVFR